MKREILNVSQECRISCLPEERLEELMETVVEPFLRENRVSGQTEPVDGAPGMLYYELYLRPEAKGTIVISYGFTESCLKYHELIYYFFWQGYQVAVMDHRGHGHSLREVDDRTIVHIDLFSRYVRDLHRFVKKVVRPAVGEGPLYLYAHSMGGCIGAFYLEQYPEDFARAVLSAPMLGLKLGACPAWAARVLCDLHVWRGKGQERLFTQSPFDPEEDFADSSADSEARHAWYLKCRREDESFQTSSASYDWGKEAINAGNFVTSRAQAQKVKTPVLLFQAGKDHLVRPDAQRRFLSRIACGRLVLVPGARHELYRAQNGVLQPYLEEIFRFYEERG
ncbi:MAG: alpha/beta fold hydrolase [Eubacteriales bacterium]|nr:alpha/beta fold hydrolase [Eubacteriales bacterium]